MPRPSRGMEGLLVGPCKVRKRGCSSSSSSSTILHNSRFKRAILVGKRGCSTTTPAPTWKMSSRSPVSTMVRALESPKYPPLAGGGHAKQGPISARKLAATLWEMNEVPSPRVREEGGEEEKTVFKKERVRRDRHADGSVRSGSLPPHLSDPSHSPVSLVARL